MLHVQSKCILLSFDLKVTGGTFIGAGRGSSLSSRLFPATHPPPPPFFLNLVTPIKSTSSLLCSCGEKVEGIIHPTIFTHHQVTSSWQRTGNEPQSTRRRRCCRRYHRWRDSRPPPPLPPGGVIRPPSAWPTWQSPTPSRPGGTYSTPRTFGKRGEGQYH